MDNTNSIHKLVLLEPFLDSKQTITKWFNLAINATLPGNSLIHCAIVNAKYKGEYVTYFETQTNIEAMEIANILYNSSTHYLLYDENISDDGCIIIKNSAITIAYIRFCKCLTTQTQIDGPSQSECIYLLSTFRIRTELDEWDKIITKTVDSAQIRLNSWNNNWELGSIICDIQTTLFGYNPDSTYSELKSALEIQINKDSEDWTVLIFGGSNDRSFEAMPKGADPADYGV